LDDAENLLKSQKKEANTEILDDAENLLNCQKKEAKNSSK